MKSYLVNELVELRPFEIGDAEMLADAMNDREIRRRMGGPAEGVVDVQGAATQIAGWTKEFYEGTTFNYVVRDLRTSVAVGSVQVGPLLNGTANIGWWTLKGHRGHGFASAAAKLAADDALDGPSIQQ